MLSYLPGQKLSRCTCAGESHPGPVHSDGTFVGRAAPEIDVFEAQVTDGAPGDVGGVLVGQVSQSAQWAVSVCLVLRMRVLRPLCADRHDSRSMQGTSGTTPRRTRSSRTPRYRFRTRSLGAQRSRRRRSSRTRTRYATKTRAGATPSMGWSTNLVLTTPCVRCGLHVVLWNSLCMVLTVHYVDITEQSLVDAAGRRHGTRRRHGDLSTACPTRTYGTLHLPSSLLLLPSPIL